MKNVIKSVIVSSLLCMQLSYAQVVGAPLHLDLLQKLVNVNSDTKNIEGLREIRALLIPHFETLGMKATEKILDKDRVVLSFQIPNSKPNVALIGHLDTVFPNTATPVQLEKRDDRLIGPGVIDMKGGIVMVLEVLSTMKAKGLALDNVLVIFNDDEEIGSPYSKQALKAMTKGIEYGLVFEPGLDDGAVVSSQSGVRWLKLVVDGKAAHAGLEPQNGIDACLDLAKKVVKLAALAKHERGLTINPGVIEGGKKPNIVCEKASVMVDVRFRDINDWDETLEQIEKIAQKSDVFNTLLNKGTVASLTKIAEMPPLPETNTKELVALASATAKRLGQSFSARGVGYGSDGNHLAENGMQLLVGVGPYGGGMHTDNEFMLLNSYQDRLKFVLALLQTIHSH